MDLNLNTNTNFDASGSIQSTQTTETSSSSVNTPTVAGPPVDNMAQSDQTQGLVTTYNAPTQNPQLPKPGEGPPKQEKKSADDKKDAKDASSSQTQQDAGTNQQVDQPQDKGGEGGSDDGGQESGGGGAGGGQGDSGSSFSGSNQGSQGGSQDGFQEGSKEGFVEALVENRTQTTNFFNPGQTASDFADVTTPTATTVPDTSKVPDGSFATSSVTGETITGIVGADKLQGILDTFYSPPSSAKELSQNVVSVGKEITELAGKMVASLPDDPNNFRLTDFLSKVGKALMQVQFMLQKMQSADSSMADKLSQVQLDKRLHQLDHQREEMDKMHKKQTDALAKQQSMGVLSKIFAFLLPIVLIAIAPMFMFFWLMLGPLELVIMSVLAVEFIDSCANVAGKPTFALQSILDAITVVINAVISAVAPGAAADAKKKAQEILKFIFLATFLVFMCVVAFPAMLSGGVMMVTDMMQKSHLFSNLVKSLGGTEQQASQADTYAALGVGVTFAILGLVLLIPAAIDVVAGLMSIINTVVQLVIKLFQMAMRGLDMLWEAIATFVSASSPSLGSALNTARSAFQSAVGISSGAVKGSTGQAVQAALEGVQAVAESTVSTVKGGGGQPMSVPGAESTADMISEGGSAASKAIQGTGEGMESALTSTGKVLGKGAQYVLDKLKSILRQLLDPEFLFGFGMDASTVGLDAVNTAMEYKFYKLKGELAILQAQIDVEVQLTDAEIKLLKKVIQDLMDSMGGFAKELNQVASLGKKIISGQSSVVANLFSISSQPS